MENGELKREKGEFANVSDASCMGSMIGAAFFPSDLFLFCFLLSAFCFLPSAFLILHFQFIKTRRPESFR
jgi:hypothetical protein